MKVTMKVHISGTRNGVDWPTKGGVIDLPADEANQMIAQGFAEASNGKPEVVTPAVEAGDEPAVEATEPQARPKVSKPARRK